MKNEDIKLICDDASKKILDELMPSLHTEIMQHLRSSSNGKETVSPTEMVTGVSTFLLTTLIKYNVKFTTEVLSKILPDE